MDANHATLLSVSQGKALTRTRSAHFLLRNPHVLFDLVVEVTHVAPRVTHPVLV
jgi:hypothetical protein